MIDYNNLPHHPMTEDIVSAICEKVGKDQKTFFRTHLAHYICVMASMMRTNIVLPSGDIEPVSMYGINLAPSGYGKGHSTAIIEKYVINAFQAAFTNTTFRNLANINIPQIADNRRIRKNSDPDKELAATEAEFARHGTLLFSFDSATPPAVKQLRNMLLMANAGSMNLQTDEIGANLMANRDVMMLFLELFNGSVKNKLVKNTTESIRSEELLGTTPTNMMLFGVGSALLDNGRIEEEFTSMLNMGYARRCFFGYIPEELETTLRLVDPMDRLTQTKTGNSDKVLDTASKWFGKLADQINAHRNLVVPDDTALLYFQYMNDCAIKAHALREHQTLLKAETQQRFFKAMKYAGGLAFIDGTPEITTDQYLNAIALAEDSGDSFSRMLSRPRAYVKLANYLAALTEDATQADMIEDLPFYRGTKSAKEDLMTQAIAWGYKNNVIIRKRFASGVEFFSGETLQKTNLDHCRVSYSRDITTGYQNHSVPFSSLHMLVHSAKPLHFINHHLSNDHRHDDNCIPGFNLVVIDVDGGVSYETAKNLLSDYKALFYTTKRNDANASNNRYRIILPTNYVLPFDSDDFKEFMNNLFDWLPFDSDTATGQRSRKWLTHNFFYEYTDGKLLDVLPFIPKTSKNEEHKQQMAQLHSYDNMERWIIQNTADGNRNNQLLRFAYVLLDSGHDWHSIKNSVLAMNAKLPDSLPETEIFATILQTITKEAAKRTTAA